MEVRAGPKVAGLFTLLLSLPLGSIGMVKKDVEYLVHARADFTRRNTAR
jgi:hypothetical protein